MMACNKIILLHERIERNTMNRRKTYALLWIVVPLLAVLLWTTGAAGASGATSDWSVVPSINPSTGNNSFTAVAALSPTNVWAVGWTTEGPLIERWNGTRWKVVANPGPSGGSLNGIFAVNDHDIWAVGVSSVAPTSFSWRTLIEHWNGRSWKIDPSPNVGTSGSILFAVARIPNTEKLWAVGAYNTTSAFFRTLTEFSD